MLLELQAELTKIRLQHIVLSAYSIKPVSPPSSSSTDATLTEGLVEWGISNRPRLLDDKTLNTWHYDHRTKPPPYYLFMKDIAPNMFAEVGGDGHHDQGLDLDVTP